MDLTQYLSNPIGKGSAITPSSSIKEDLNMQFGLLQNKMNMEVYKNSNVIVYKIKLPSRSYDKVVYDIIIEYNLKDIGSSETINNVPFKCFSNCPSFIYTYAHIFEKKELLCPWLKDKYSRDILNKAPDTRNEYKIISFERSLYLALKYISLLGRNKVTRIDILSNSFKEYTELSRNIKTEREILSRINEFKEKKGSKKTEGGATKKETESKNSVGKVKSNGKAIQNTKMKKTSKTKKI